jgi:hypothetical protein
MKAFAVSNAFYSDLNTTFEAQFHSNKPDAYHRPDKISHSFAYRRV